jgi:hypothetical protein
MMKIVLLMGPLTFIFCGILEPNGDQIQLNSNKLIWEKLNIDNYQFNLKSGCQCIMSGEYKVIVKKFIVDTVIPDTSIFAPISRVEYPHVLTISSLFNEIQNAINGKAEKLSVTYNRDYGYPEKIDIDYSSNWIDDEYAYAIDGFAINK